MCASPAQNEQCETHAAASDREITAVTKASLVLTAITDATTGGHPPMEAACTSCVPLSSTTIRTPSCCSITTMLRVPDPSVPPTASTNSSPAAFGFSGGVGGLWCVAPFSCFVVVEGVDGFDGTDGFVTSLPGCSATFPLWYKDCASRSACCEPHKESATNTLACTQQTSSSMRFAAFTASCFCCSSSALISSSNRDKCCSVFQPKTQNTKHKTQTQQTQTTVDPSVRFFPSSV